MSANKDPMAQFGRKIAAAVTRDPAFEAMFTEGRAIPNTWGNIASQLFEQGLVEPNPQTVVEFLGIEREQLTDPTLRFTSPHEAYDFGRDFKRRKEAEYRAKRVTGVRKFAEHMKGVIEAQTTEPDTEQLQKLDEEFRKLQDRRVVTQEDHETVSTRKGLLRLQYMAVKSGLAIPLPEFAAKVLGYEEEDGFTVAERVSALEDVIDGEVIRKHLPISPGEVPAADVPVGHDLYRVFASALGYAISRSAYFYAEEEWGRIEHIFIAPHHSEHPLFAGNEK